MVLFTDLIVPATWLQVCHTQNPTAQSGIPSRAVDSDGALLSRVESPLLDISSKVHQNKIQAEGEKNPQY
jgi:hypothetical protein